MQNAKNSAASISEALIKPVKKALLQVLFTPSCPSSESTFACVPAASYLLSLWYGVGEEGGHISSVRLKKEFELTQFVIYVLTVQLGF